MRHTQYDINVGQKLQPPGYSFESAGYEQFQVIYVSGGTVYFESRYERQSVSQGGVLLLRQGSSFRLSCRGSGYHGVCFIAKGKLPREFIGPAEAVAASAEIMSLAKLMSKQLATGGVEAAAVLEGLGRAMAWEAVGLSQKSADMAGRRSPRWWAESARQLLDATLYTTRTPRDILKSMPLSYRQVSRHFAAVFGLSPKQYQLKAKMEEAKRLLADTQMPVTAVAIELGWCSSQHFATQFASYAGCSPSAWRSGTSRRSQTSVRAEIKQPVRRNLH